MIELHADNFREEVLDKKERCSWTLEPELRTLQSIAASYRGNGKGSPRCGIRQGGLIQIPASGHFPEGQPRTCHPVVCRR